MVEYLFWISFAFVFYVYFGYPLILILWGRWRPKAIAKHPWIPDVTVVIAAHNEKGNIQQKIQNCLSLDYPPDKLQVLVSLDGSTDGTDVLALKFAGQGVHLVVAPRHKGKAAAINSAVAQAHGTIVVFVDVRQILDRNVIRELTANFSDPSVGAVSGELVLLDADHHESKNGFGLYWRYEKVIRMAESRVHSVIGATGAIYAIRRELFRPIADDTILDDVVIPMSIVLRGKRVVFEPGAKAFERAGTRPGVEFGRKVRTLTGNFQMFAAMPQVFNPWRDPVLLQFVSHKVARLAIPYALICLFVSNLFLRGNGYLAFLVLQTAWYVLAMVGYRASTLEWSGRVPVSSTKLSSTKL